MKQIQVGKLELIIEPYEPPITRSSKRLSSEGDFLVKFKDGERLEDDRLYVPQNVFDVLQRASVRSAHDFYIYAKLYPEEITQALGWTPTQFQQACKKLIDELFAYEMAKFFMLSD